MSVSFFNNRKPPPVKTKKDIQREMRDVIRQITASVTFLPLLDGQCKYISNIGGAVINNVKVCWCSR